MSYHIKKYMLFLLCTALLHSALFSHIPIIAKTGTVSSQNKTVQLTEKNDQSKKIEKKNPTYTQSWRKVFSLRLKELNKADLKNIGKSLLGIAAIGLIYQYGLKDILTDNAYHDLGNNNPGHPNNTPIQPCPKNNHDDSSDSFFDTPSSSEDDLDDNPDVRIINLVNNNNINAQPLVPLSAEQRKNITRLVDEDVLIDDAQNNIALHMIADFLARPKKIKEHNGFYINAIAADGHIGVTGSDGGLIKIWNLRNDQLLHTIEEDNAIGSLAIYGNTIAIGLEDGTIKIYNTNTDLLHTFKEYADAVTSIDIHENMVIAGSNKSAITTIWDVNTGTVVRIGDGGDYGPLSHKSNRTDLVAICDNKAAMGTPEGIINVWDILNNQLLFTLVDRNENGYSNGIQSVNEIQSVAMKDNRIVTGSRSGTIKIWDINNGQLLHTLPRHKSWITSIAIDGNKVITGSVDGTAKVWNINTGTLLRTCAQEGYPQKYKAVAIAGNKVLTIKDDSIAQLWPLQADLNNQKSKFNDPDHALFWIKHNVSPLQANLIACAYAHTQKGCPLHPYYDRGVKIKPFKIERNTDNAHIWITFPEHVRNYLKKHLKILISPGKPTEKDGYIPAHNWDGKKVEHRYRMGKGWPDKDGNVWMISGSDGTWDVVSQNGKYITIAPGGHRLEK